MKRKYKTCKNCEKSFFGRGKIFCSNLCKGLSRKTRITKSCQRCNEKFDAFQYSLKLGYGVFCSYKCKVQAQTGVTNLVNDRNCLACNKDFHAKQSVIKKGFGKYCSFICSRECKRGIAPPNKGVPMPLEQREKLSIAGKGKMPGALNPAWKGGISSVNKIARGARPVELWREAVFKRDDFTCKWCKIRGGKLHADHIKMFAFHPELRTEISNGQTLCEDCHSWKTKWDLKIFIGKVPELNFA